MYYTLLFILFVTSVSGSFWDVLADDFSVFVSGITSRSGRSIDQEDAYLSIQQLANKNGYPMETHSVVTEDGYILTMHRMKNKQNAASKVVFLMHGIWQSSDDWLLLGPDKALAYILADQGYDVWMGNARGNRHSLKHKSLTPNMSSFWEFSWEEIGLYDLPAMIDYILGFTGERRLFYVGFSQGTTAYFVMNSMRPQYNDKIRVMIALAPVAYIGNARHILLKIFSPAHSFLQYIMWNFNIYSPSTEFFNKITPMLCKVLSVACDNLIFTLMGSNHVNESLWPVILGHIPTGSSTLQFIHYGQMVNSRRFCRFDFGRGKNIVKYGRDKPPDYRLELVTSQVVLFFSGNDMFSDRRDVELLWKRLPKVVELHYVNHFTHVDFMYAEEASVLIYYNIVKLIKSISNEI